MPQRKKQYVLEDGTPAKNGTLVFTNVVAQSHDGEERFRGNAELSISSGIITLVSTQRIDCITLKAPKSGVLKGIAKKKASIAGEGVYKFARSRKKL